MLPWLCFSIPSTTTTSSTPSSVAKLVMCTGQIKTFRRPVLVSAVMSEHPLHRVCRSDSFLVGQKVPALDAEDVLELGQSYFLLPSKFFSSALSLVSIAASFSPSDRAALLRMVEIQRTPSGKLRISVSEEFMEKDEEGEEEARGRVCSTEELERHYKIMVKKKGDVWKPKLETIKEKKEKKNTTKRDKKHHHRESKMRHPPPPPPPPATLTSKVAKSKKKDNDRGKQDPMTGDKAIDDSPSAPPPPPPPPPLPKEKKTKSSKSKKEKTQSLDKNDPSSSTPKSESDKDKDKDDPETIEEAKNTDNQPPSSTPPPPPPLAKEKKAKSIKIKKEKARSQDKKDPSGEHDPPPSPPPSPPSPPVRWSMANAMGKLKKKEKRKIEKIS